jgi:hypothetical protein
LVNVGVLSWLRLLSGMAGIRTDPAMPECKKAAIMEQEFVWSVD